MRRLSNVIVLFIVFFAAIPAWAEHAEQRLQPVEVYLCNFKKGENRKRFNRILAPWNKWMDIYYGEAYRAWVLTPELNDPSKTFEITWLAGWKDGHGMGRSMDNWAEKGGEQMAIFMSILDCPVHAIMAAEQLVEGGAEQSENSIASFIDCTVPEGQSLEEALDAVREFARNMADKGSKASQWIFYPLWGGATDATFQWVELYPNYHQLGADFERFGNESSFRSYDDLLHGKLDCGLPRVSRATKVRDSGFGK